MSAPTTAAQTLQTTLQQVPLLNTINNASTIATIIQITSQRFTGVDLQQHKIDPNLVSYVCNCVESSFPDSANAKVDKKTIALQVMAGLIPNLTPDDNNAISQLIEFIHSTGQISAIVKEVEAEVIPLLKRCLNFFFKKVSS